jgi:hypothetical protein
MAGLLAMHIAKMQSVTRVEQDEHHVITVLDRKGFKRSHFSALFS